MGRDFCAVAEEHRARYPLMEPQDYGKLAYQSEFGPGHMAPSLEEALAGIRREWEQAGPAGEVPPAEGIGNGLSRFHLTDAWDPEQAAELLARLFLLTAQVHAGSGAGLARRLDSLAGLAVPGMERWLAEYRRQGCPAVRHSARFQAAYRPHYRLLRTEYAGCFPALLAIRRRAEAGAPAVIAIDGRCGSGKTRLAALIARLFPCRVVHMDDFYLPFDARPPGWADEPGGHMDFGRLLSEVLLPARTGAALCFRPYCCRTGRLEEAVCLPAGPLTVLEGSYSAHPRLAARIDLRIVLTCSREEQARRLREREGARFSAFESRWIPLEERYFQICRPEAAGDFRVDTSRFLD